MITFKEFLLEKKDLGVMTSDDGIKRSVNKVISFAERNKKKVF